MSSQDPSATSSGSVAGAGGRPLSTEDFVVLNDEIRAFVRAGIPLDLGLRGVGGRSRGALRQVSESLSQRLESGASLEEALRLEERHLPPAYRAVLTSGLRTGRIDEVLKSLSELAASTASLQRQLRLSLVYPAVILVLAYAMFVAFVIYLVPQIQRTHDIFGMEVTAWATRLEWLHRHVFAWGGAAPAIVVGLLLLRWLIQRFFSEPDPDLMLGRWIPGRRDLSLARFSRLLSVLVKHGVPLPEGLRLAGTAAGDSGISQQADELARAVEDGQSLTQVIRSASGIPAFLRWLIAVGTRQGTLPALLQQGAELHELRALTKLEWFRRIAPPVIVIGCCGGITLLYGLMLFLPLREMIRNLGMP